MTPAGVLGSYVSRFRPLRVDTADHLTTGACPDTFFVSEWGCQTSLELTTPLMANQECATQHGAALPPLTGGRLNLPYISSINRR